MIRRPKPGETEEDLLRMQEEFMSKEGGSAAAAVSKGDKRKNISGNGHDKGIQIQKDVVQLAGTGSGLLPGATSDPPKKKSKFKSGRPTPSGGPMFRGQRVDIQLDGDEDPETAMDRQDTHITSVLTKIMEHDTSQSNVPLPRPTAQAFPTALHRGQSAASQDGKPRKKRSLFAQQFDSTSLETFGVTSMPQFEQPIRQVVTPLGNTEPMDIEQTLTAGAHPNKTHLISGAGLVRDTSDPSQATADVKQIHQENIGKLSAMTEGEILQEQAKLRQMLDPNVLKFLQSKGKGTDQETSGKIPPSNLHSSDSSSANPNLQSRSGVVIEPVSPNLTPDETSDDGVTVETEVPVAMETVSSNATGIQVEGATDDSLSAKTNDKVDPPVEVSKDWMHMDKLEPDKLSWLKDLPKPSAQSKEGFQARFAFNGMLVARDADVSVREGLHHHGDEQEIPGYSLEELFTLSRSSVIQQRVLSLQTLARVIYNARMSDIGGELTEPLIPRLLEAGVLFLFRWSLDDSNEGVISACVEGLAALLVQPGDEDVLDRVLTWYGGAETPPMRPSITDDEDELGQKIDDKDLSDPQLADQDMIKALIRMHLLKRLRYILEVVRPHAPVVLNALAILIRIARHSQAATQEIMKCPRLMQTVFDEFLPTSSWKSQGDLVSNAYHYPLILALKLTRVICQNGRYFTASLLSRFNLMSVVVRYVSMEPTDMPMNLGEAFQLSIEAFRVWQICVMYGLACDTYRDLYPLLMQQLQLFQRLSILPLDSSQAASAQAANKLQMTRACTLLNMLEGVVHVAGTAAALQQKLSTSSPSDLHSSTSSSKDPPIPPPPIDWSHVTGVVAPVEMCAKRWLSEMTRCSEVMEPEALSLAGGSLNFLAAVYENWTHQPSYSPVDCLQHIEQMVNNMLVPFMTSTSFYSVVFNLKNHSSVQYPPPPSTASSPSVTASLPDFACHPHDESVVFPCVRRTSSYGFASGLLRLVCTLLKIHKGMASKFVAIIESTYVTEYLKAICRHQNHMPGSQLSGSWARYEHHVLYYLVKLYFYVTQQNESCHRYSILYHSTALVLLTSLQPGYEHYVHSLLSTVLFHTDFLAEGRLGDPIASDLADMLTLSSTKDKAHSRSGQPTRGELLQDAYNHLASIRTLYMVYFGSAAHALSKSRARALHTPHDISTMMLPEFTGSLVPMDWIFLPLMHLYVEAQKAELLGKTVKSLPAHIMSSITDTLRWVYMLETWRPESLKTVPQAAKIARLYCVFLTGNDLFMEDAVSRYMWPILRLYTQPENLKALDFNVTVPGVSSFHDYFMSILTQYEAVSFGNHLFAHFVMLPLQQRFTPELRKAIWFDRVEVLRSLGLPIKECLIPMENFLQPQENHLELLDHYLTCLVSGSVRPSWSPIMHLVAVAQLNGFLFSHDGLDKIEIVNARLKMIRQVLSLRDKDLQQRILRYEGVDTSTPYGFSLLAELPQERLVILKAAEKR